MVNLFVDHIQKSIKAIPDITTKIIESEKFKELLKKADENVKLRIKKMEDNIKNLNLKNLKRNVFLQEISILLSTEFKNLKLNYIKQ